MAAGSCSPPARCPGACRLERPPGALEPVEADRTTQFNDGKCDPDGRFIAGTAAHDPRFTGALYHVDTIAQSVNRYRWDAALGVSSDPEPFIQIPSEDGLPDGLTVDGEGCLWLAIRGAGEVRRYTPTATCWARSSCPPQTCRAVRSGGSAGQRAVHHDAAQAAPQHGRQARLAGDVFVVTTPVRGQRRTPFPRHGIAPELLEPGPYGLG